ncbi:MAG: hypothetical protein ACXU86_12935 [Archangium sp.]
MAGGTRRWRLGLTVVALGLASGCAAPADDAQARLAEDQAEEKRLDAAFDAMETRLLANQARMHLWQELGERHQQVSAIQCRVTDEHLLGIARNLEHQEEKARQLPKRRRMAEATVLTSARQDRLNN